MIGTLISIIINTAAFFGIAKILPGFHIKNERTALIVSLTYSLLGFVASILAIPLVGIVTILLAFIAFIPIIGPLIAASGFFVTLFIITFGISIILLVIIDKVLEDFKMDSLLTAAVASALLAAINVLVRIVLPGI